MTAVATQERRSPSAEFRQQLDAMTPQFALALPPHVPAERFVRIVMTAVQSNPDLLNKDRQSLFEASMKCAQDGLLPDGRDAALVIHGSKVTYMPMVAGILSKVRRSGELKSIGAHVVYEHDEFDYLLGDEERIHHRPLIGGDRGKPIITYAVAHTKDGGVYREVMTEAQVMAVKAISRAKGGPWSGPFADEMRRKTAIRRLSKRLPMSTDLLAVIERDDDMYDLNQAQRREVPSLQARLSAPREDGPTEGFTAHHALTHNPETSDAPILTDVPEQAPAADGDEPSQAGADTFPGDDVMVSSGDGAAEPPEPNGNEEKGSVAFDHIAWADRFVADLPFLTKEQLDALENNKLELARFAQLKAIAIDKAQEFEDALRDARAAFA